METLNIELDEYQKMSRSGRIFNIIFGFGALIFSTVIIYRNVSAGNMFWDYFIFILFALLGIYVLLYTFGIFYRISRRYVVVNDKGIEYKLSYIYPSTSFSWKDLEKVDIRTLRIFFHAGPGSPDRMKLGDLFYSDIKKLKRVLSEYCTEKEINWSDSTVESELVGKVRKEKTT